VCDWYLHRREDLKRLKSLYVRTLFMHFEGCRDLGWQVSCERTAHTSNMSHLRHQPHPQRRTNPADRVKTWLAAWAQGSVQGFAGDAGVFGNLGHAASAGNVAEGGG
jgi:hypothetical protein